MIERIRQLFKRETRAASQGGFTAEVMASRGDFIAGRRGVAELTATVQSCISLWEGGLGQADVAGTDLLSPQALTITARSLALRGEALLLIRDDRLVPCSDWDVSTRDGLPTAYRCTISEAGGGRSVTALADEVLHFRIGSDAVTPWSGSSPLRRASLSADLLHSVESALSETFASAPLGSMVVPFPESAQANSEQLARSFRGQRGRVLLRESVNTSAAGGPTPQTDWRPSDLSPDLSRSMSVETLDRARTSIANVYGVLPALLSVQGPAVREGQRHMAQWTLAPMAKMIGDEASAKLGAEVSLDVLQPLQAYDAGGRARAFSGVLQGLAQAKEAGLSDEQLDAAAKFSGVMDHED